MDTSLMLHSIQAFRVNLKTTLDFFEAGRFNLQASRLGQLDVEKLLDRRWSFMPCTPAPVRLWDVDEYLPLSCQTLLALPHSSLDLLILRTTLRG